MGVPAPILRDMLRVPRRFTTKKVSAVNRLLIGSPIINNKRVAYKFPRLGGCSKGLDAFRFFFKLLGSTCRRRGSSVSSTRYIFSTCRSTPVAQLAPRNLLTRWDVSSIPANGIFLTKN